jgi:hypothetical protein
MMTMPPSAHALSANMMTAMPQTTKPKIGFSIDSIVGNRNQSSKSPINYSHDSEGSEAPLSPLSDYAYQHGGGSPKHHHSELAAAIKLNEYAQIELRNKIKRSMSASPPALQQHHEKNMESDIQRHEIQKLPHDSQTRLSGDDRRSHSPASPAPTSHNHQQQHHQHMQKQPIIVPGIPANILRQVPHGAQLQPSLQSDMMAQNPFFRLVTFPLLPT